MRSKILDLLREAGDSYLSGEEMAKRLGVSRTAVWKHIQELRRDGYDIVSHSRSGYSLQSAPDTLRPEEIKNGLRTRRIGREIRFYPTVDSTNLEAKRLAQQGAPDGLIVVAEEQGKGRGRSSARSSHRRARESGSQSSCAPTSCRRKRRSVRCCRPSLSRRPQRISA